jgi:hypothetical protein
VQSRLVERNLHADITISPAGHENLKLTTKVMAATALRLVKDPELAG